MFVTQDKERVVYISALLFVDDSFFNSCLFAVTKKYIASAYNVV